MPGQPARVHSEATSRVAIKNAHGKPVVMIAADSFSLIDQLRAKCGMHLHDQLLSSPQSYYEGFEEKMAEGQLSAETLAHVISPNEEDLSKRRSPKGAATGGFQTPSA